MPELSELAAVGGPKYVAALIEAAKEHLSTAIEVIESSLGPPGIKEPINVYETLGAVEELLPVLGEVPYRLYFWLAKQNLGDLRTDDGTEPDVVRNKAEQRLGELWITLTREGGLAVQQLHEARQATSHLAYTDEAARRLNPQDYIDFDDEDTP
jgi:hypothetical protein